VNRSGPGWCGVLMAFTLLFGAAGCLTESQQKHEDMGDWIWVINDGYGAWRPFFVGQTYYERMADMLLDEHRSVRVAAAGYFTTSSVAFGRRYVYVPDAYVDSGRADMLRNRLLEARRRAAPESRERYWMLEALVQLKMRQYLWAHPEFGIENELPPEAPQRGFGSFSLWHYPIFAKLILSEGDEEYRQHWGEFRQLNQLLFGWDPINPKYRPSATSPSTSPSNN